MFTKEQYEVLRGVIQPQFNSTSSLFTTDETIPWVWSNVWALGINAKKSYRSRLAFLRRPLSDMPLYINDPDYLWRTLAIWRLKIGR